MNTIPPELIDPLIGLALAIIGYFTRLFQKRKSERLGTNILKELNDPQKPDSITIYKNKPNGRKPANSKK